MSPESKGSEVFSTEDVQMHMKRHPISLVIMEMQTKPQQEITSYLLGVPQMARNSERRTVTSARMEGDMEKSGPSYRAGGNVKW